MHGINSMSRGMPRIQTGATQYHAQLGLQDKGRAFNRLVVHYLEWLGSIKEMRLLQGARCVGLVPCCGQDCY